MNGKLSLVPRTSKIEENPFTETVLVASSTSWHVQCPLPTVEMNVISESTMLVSPKIETTNA